jgi:hypothetical protein
VRALALLLLVVGCRGGPCRDYDECHWKCADKVAGACERAMSLAHDGCVRGDNAACGAMVFLVDLQRAPAPPDFDLPSLRRRLCEAGDPHACERLAFEARDPAERARLERRVYELHERRCFDGQRIECAIAFTELEEILDADPPRAVKLCERACAVHFVSPCLKLAELYEDGRGVAKDPTRASALYQAASLRLAEGCREDARSPEDCESLIRLLTAHKIDPSRPDELDELRARVTRIRARSH